MSGARGGAIPKALCLAGLAVGCGRLIGLDGLQYDVPAPVVVLSDTQVGGELQERLGYNVALEGDTVLAGAHAPGSSFAGATYVVRRQHGFTWRIVQKLTAESYAEPNAFFGQSVALNRGWAVIGAPGGSPSPPGAVYFFKEVKEGSDGTFAFSQRITLPDSHGGDLFGQQVAVLNGRAAVGVPDQTDPTAESVFVYDLGADGQWRQSAVLRSPDGVPGQSFGWSLALSDNRIVVSAFGNITTPATPQAIYVFRRSASGWDLEQKIVPPTPAIAFAADDLLSGTDDLIAVSGRAGSPAFTAYGASVLYIFERDATATTNPWRPQAVGIPPTVPADVAANVEYPWRTAISGRTVETGMRSTGIDHNAVFLFEQRAGAWTSTRTLAPAVVEEDDFGWAVAFDPKVVVIGAIAHASKGGELNLFLRSAPGGP